MKREWINEQTKKAHLEKHVINGSSFEKNAWELVFINNTGKNIDMHSYSKKIDIYENESYSLFGKDIRKKATKIYMYIDKYSGITSLNLSRDDFLTTGIQDSKVKTCFFKKELLIDTEILSYILDIIDMDLENFEFDNELIKLYNKQLYFYKSDELYEKYIGVIQNNNIPLYKLIEEDLDGKKIKEEKVKYLNLRKKRICQSILCTFLENQVFKSCLSAEQKKLYSLMISYLSNTSRTIDRSIFIYASNSIKAIIDEFDKIDVDENLAIDITFDYIIHSLLFYLLILKFCDDSSFTSDICITSEKIIYSFLQNYKLFERFSDMYEKLKFIF